MKYLRIATLFALVAFFISTTACFYASTGPSPGAETAAVVATGLPGHPEEIWNDAPDHGARPMPLTSETYVELAKRVNPAVVNIFMLEAGTKDLFC